MFPGLSVKLQVRTEESPVFPHPECNQLKFFCYDDISLACKSWRTLFFFSFLPCKILLWRVFPNCSDTPRPTNPGELNFLAKLVRLVLSSSQQTCILLCSLWLLPLTHPANLLPTSHCNRTGRKHPVSTDCRHCWFWERKGLLHGMEQGKGGEQPLQPAAGTSIPPSVLNTLCCASTGHSLEQGGTDRDVFSGFCQ